MSFTYHTTKASSVAPALLHLGQMGVVEYRHCTVSVMTQLRTKDEILHSTPIVLAIHDSVNSIKIHLQAIFRGHFNNRQMSSIEVHWMGSRSEAASVVFDSQRTLALDEGNVLAVVQLIMQRSGVDELIVTLEDDNHSAKAEASNAMGAQFPEDDEDDDEQGDKPSKSPRKRKQSATKPTQADSGYEKPHKRGKKQDATTKEYEKRQSVSQLPLKAQAVMGSVREAREENRRIEIQRAIPADDPEEIRRNNRLDAPFGGSIKWREPNYTLHENADLEEGETPQDKDSMRDN